MPISIQAPPFAFVQFSVSDSYSNCLGESIQLCLPVFDDHDVQFQFQLTATTDEEMDELLAAVSPVTIGLARECDEEFLTTFATVERFKVGLRSVLFNFTEGFTDFQDFINVGECFVVKIVANIGGTDYPFCSNCFQRIGDDCLTSVVEYGSDDNAFGFNYCAGNVDSGPTGEECDPTFISFTNQSTLNIPYTASLLAAYGNFPSVEVWIRDSNNDLVKSIVEVKMNNVPPDNIEIDFGGPATGQIKLS